MSDTSPLSRNIRRVGGLDMPGGGQVVVSGGFAYVGHMKPPFGTTIIDVSDPRNPRVAAELRLSDDFSHSHKVRVVGDLMITNVEQNNRHLLRKGATLPEAQARLTASLGRPPSDEQLAAELGVAVDKLPLIKAANARGYNDGGFRIFDISDRRQPREIAYQRTHGFGVHRFDADARYAYISTEMEGYLGNILAVYDLQDPTRPEEVARWHMPGQHVAAGETPSWPGYSHRLHHAMRCGDELWAAVWRAGFRVLDATDVTQPREIAACNYHPPFPEPTHTIMPFEQTLGGRRIALAVDEEHDHVHGRPHGGLVVFDVTDFSNIQMLSLFEVSERDSPWARARGRFGAHQYREKLDGSVVYAAWFAGGLRVVDMKDPTLPVEVAHYIPEPIGGEPSPQTNDVDVDENGLIYLIDRNRGFEIVEMTGV